MSEPEPVAASTSKRKDVQQYIDEQSLNPLFEHLYHEVLVNQPSDPVTFLKNLLGRKVVPKIIVSGAPASGKGTQCQSIVEHYNVVHISTGDLLREEVRNQTALGIEAQDYMTKGLLVPDAMIIQLVTDRLAREDVQSAGWMLDGFPRTRAQALALQVQGIIPDVVLLLDVPDEVVTERIEGRRTDPVTGRVYHLTFNPPPYDDVDLVSRLEQRSDDTVESIRRRLEIYHRNERDIVSCYSSVVTRIDGTRDKDAVFADVKRTVESALGGL
eukprot:PhM_4_TR6836/c0_g1_i1/m.12715/K00939/adk, AK; adenylate kinase